MLGELDVHPGLSFFPLQKPQAKRDPLGVVLCYLGKGQCDQSVVVPLIFLLWFLVSAVQEMLQTNSKILRFSQWCLVYG